MPKQIVAEFIPSGERDSRRKTEDGGPETDEEKGKHGNLAGILQQHGLIY